MPPTHLTHTHTHTPHTHTHTHTHTHLHTHTIHAKTETLILTRRNFLERTFLQYSQFIKKNLIVLV